MSDSVQSGAIPLFLEQMTKWQFCPPSNNLWTVEIVEHKESDGNTMGASLSSLYSNIIKVNDQFSMHFTNSYGILKNKENPDVVKNFITSAQHNQIGLFLATDISFNSNAVTIVDKASNFAEPFTGWLSYGKIQQGRTHNRAAVIKFYQSNWDINEVLFDPWIAAIGQQGLIEGDESDKLYNIKADIYIKEYAASSVNAKTNTWVLRKQIKLTKAFPKSREQYKYSYSPDNAGAFLSTKVDFEFENYAIEYMIYENEKNIAKNKNIVSGKVGSTPIAINTNTTEAGGAQHTNAMKNAEGMA